MTSVMQSHQIAVPATIAVCPECGWSLAWQTLVLKYEPFEQTAAHHSVLGMGVVQNRVSCFNGRSLPHLYDARRWQSVYASCTRWQYPYLYTDHLVETR